METVITFDCFNNILLRLHLHPTVFKKKKGGEGFRTANPKRRKENSNMKLPKSKNKQTERVKGKLSVVMKS